MARILFYIFPQQSHHNATFGLARELIGKGHSVIYAAIRSMKPSIEANGIEYFEIGPYDNVFSINSLKKYKSGIRGLLQKYQEVLRFSRTCTKAIEHKDWFEHIIGSLKPEIILIDGVYKLISLQLIRHRVKYVFIETTVSTRRRPGIPPLSSSRVPIDRPFASLLNLIEWNLYYFLCPGIRKVFKDACIKFQYPIMNVDFERYFIPGFNSIPEINTSFRSFDYPHEPTSNEYYFNHVNLKRSDTLYDYKYEEAHEFIVRSQRRNIFCSFGTAAGRYPVHICFLKEMIKVARKAPLYNFVMCVEDDSLRRSLRRIKPDNAFIFRKVPQMEFLKLCDVMINHGGLNSISECILMGVPMLVCPGERTLDQYGNAGRVKYHGIGIQGSMGDSSKKILKNLEQILYSPSFKKNLSSILARIEADRSSDSNIEVIETMLGVKP